MSASEAALTVNQVWDLALPPGTELAGGTAGLSRRVEWVAALRASFPMFGELGEGYLALAHLPTALSLDANLTASQIIRELHGAQASALVLDEPISADEAALADALGMPVLIVPAGSDLRQLERDVLRALVDREGQWARREVEARRLLQQAYDRDGLAGLADALTRLLAAPVTIADAQGRVLAGAPVDTADNNQFSIQGGGRALGCVLLATPQAGMRALDALYARQAAEICAVDMLQRVARLETEERLGADLVEQLLATPLDADALSARLARLGYPLTDHDRHLALALSCETASGEAAEQAAHSLRLHLQPHVYRILQVRYRSGLVLICALKPHLSERRLRALLSQAGSAVSLGVGRPGSDLAGLSTSISQALDACALGLRLHNQPGPHHYGELGLYRLLAGLHGSPGSPARAEIDRFLEETLGPLARYDREHHAELLETLDCLFAVNANVSQAAARLAIHRNTLIYRLRRIVEITGLDIDDPETRLALQVALAIHRVTR